MKVAVIGGAGRMGRWFARYFASKGKDVVIWDPRHDEAESVARSIGVKLAKDRLEAVDEAGLVVVSVPIEVTRRVLQEISVALESSATAMEISSLKSHVIPALKDIAERGVTTLSIHPLFGPGVQGIFGERVALVPVSDPASELTSARRLLSGAEIVVVDAEEHDRAMALTLSLTHFLNIAFTSVIGNEDLAVLKKLGGKTFALQLVLGEAVMTEDPSLYASIQMSNGYTVEYQEKFLTRAETLKEYVVNKDFKGFSQFCRDTRSSISKDADFAIAYESMYKALQAI